MKALANVNGTVPEGPALRGEGRESWEEESIESARHLL